MAGYVIQATGAVEFEVFEDYQIRGNKSEAENSRPKVRALTEINPTNIDLRNRPGFFMGRRNSNFAKFCAISVLTIAVTYCMV